jgi:hypothetical protein
MQESDMTAPMAGPEVHYPEGSMSERHALILAMFAAVGNEKPTGDQWEDVEDIAEAVVSQLNRLGFDVVKRRRAA